ncbi:hypothetical protein C8R47DRAFT_1221590 [Mycena vitilis]|nr:hypothetical protein C8R47DRAFT_1221590 [Mycena vitilis]
MSTIIVPSGISYVAAALTSTIFLLTAQTITVTGHRTRAGIRYPKLYADAQDMETSPSAFVFNCAQRAHQNTIESIGMIYMMTALVATKYPIVAASALGMWVLSRVAYTIGYVGWGPESVRIFDPLNIAAIFNFDLYNAAKQCSKPDVLYPGLVALVLGSVYTSYRLLAAGI